MKILISLAVCALSASTLLASSSLIEKAKKNGLEAIPSDKATLMKMIDDKKDPITDAKVELGENFISTQECQEVV